MGWAGRKSYSFKILGGESEDLDQARQSKLSYLVTLKIFFTNPTLVFISFHLKESKYAFHLFDTLKTFLSLTRCVSHLTLIVVLGGGEYENVSKKIGDMRFFNCQKNFGGGDTNIF